MSLSSEREVVFIIPGPVGALEVKCVHPAASGPLAEAGYLAVVCHPNPTRGGDMHNKVVTTLLRTYRDLGVPVLAFNFRGVGKSEGVFDRGLGEQEDLQAVIRWGKQQWPSARLMLAGFSFGSSIAAAVSHRRDDLAHLLLVAPPVDRYLYEQDGRFPVPVCVVQGGQDELIPASQVYRWVDQLQSPVRLIRYPDASHFFHGCLTALKADVSRVLQGLPASSF